MAGTIFGLPLSIQLDDNGDPMAGCKLYIYAATTTTPATAYEDFGLTAGLELSFPIVADSAGRIPQFWLADGSYRVRLTDALGNEIFDLDSITAIGASSGTGSGSGVSASAIFATGDVLWVPVSGARSGWIRLNGRTFGSSASGGTERANADCEDLYSYAWTNFSDTLCPVSGGRGVSAAADWAANKPIATLDMRGRTNYGLDDMGATTAGVIATSTLAGVALGQETKTILQANLPNVSLSSSALAISPATVDRNLSPASATANFTAGGNTYVQSVAATTSNTSISGTVPLGGSGTALATLSPGRAGSWYWKL